ncbi:MAG: DNA internalization-related competence protein ComEC/Rec2 [Gemmatimonadetes bacterium]|nr:DNA internalization-related competence protein ComEC/Rec2 [Gemmatimonadota bacterium]
MNPLLLLLAFGAGLATGLVRFLGPGAVGAALLLVGAAGWRRPLLLFVAAFALGRVLAVAAWSETARSCAAALHPGEGRLVLRLVDPVEPGAGAARAEVVGAGCRGMVDTRWPPAERMGAGAEVVSEGRWLPRTGRSGRPEGTWVARRFARHAFRPTVAERLRNWLAHATRRLYGERTGTVEALIVNRRGAMAPELRDRYARAGLVHILSLSGFHVGVIVAWIVLLGRLAGLPPVRAELAGAVVAVLYVAFLGWPPPAARAALLASLAAISHWRQRHPAPLALLGTTCLVVLLADPWAVLDAGAWLSALALLGALVATRWSDRALGTGWFWRTLAGSVGATLATAPVAAALFGMVSLAGLALNFVAIPLAAIAVPGVVLSLLAAAVLPPLAAPLAAASGALLGLLDQLAWWGGSWDALTVIQAPEAKSALPWALILLVAWWGTAGGTSRVEAGRRWALAAALGSWVLLFAESLNLDGDRSFGLTLHFLDVGQGDAAVLRTPGGHWVLIDAGPAGGGRDAGRQVSLPFLARHRAWRLTLAVISHAHLDHFGGLRSVLDREPVDRVLEPAALVPDSLYTGLLDLLAADGIPWTPARDGQAFVLDGVRFRVLHPEPHWTGDAEDLNEDSVVLLVEYGDFRALFVGDAGLPVERRLAGRVGRVTVLKVGHHGSRSASGAAWLAELAPAVAVMSLGAGNRYGHPHGEVLARFRQGGIGLWRTDQEGTVTIRTDGQSVRVDADGRDTTFTLQAGHHEADRADEPGDDHRALHPRPGGEVPRGDR